jgi:hypothetical protein
MRAMIHAAGSPSEIASTAPAAETKSAKGVHNVKRTHER